MRKNKKMVVLRNGSMVDDHARSMTSWCDCQAWLPQERGESMAHKVVERVSSAEKSQQPKDQKANNFGTQAGTESKQKAKKNKTNTY